MLFKAAFRRPIVVVAAGAVVLSPLLLWGRVSDSWKMAVVACAVLGLGGLVIVRCGSLGISWLGSQRTLSSPTTSRWFARRFMAAYLLLFVACATFGHYHFSHQIATARRAAQNQLVAIADVKVKQILDWREERLGDARSIMREPFVRGQIQKFLAGSSDDTIRSRLLAWMDLIREHNRCFQVVLLDSHLKVRLASPHNRMCLGPIARECAAEAVRSHRVVMSELHRNRVSGEIHLDIMAPLTSADSSPESGASKPNVREEQLIGTIAMEVDPSKSLYANIQSWPTSSSTAETLLVRREDNDVVYLSVLRHQANTALPLRMCLEQWQDSPAVKAVMGQEGILDGIDYRKVPVLAVARAVAGTPWFIVAKLDEEEVYAPLRERAWSTGGLFAAVFLVGAMGMGLLWRQRDNQWLKKQLAAERENQLILESADEGILGMDAQGRHLFVNQAAARMLGYEAAELLGRDAHSTWHSKNADGGEYPREECTMYAAFQRGCLRHCDEDVFWRKDGTYFPVEYANRLIREPDTPVAAVLTFCDITERKRAEGELLAERANLKAIFNSSPIVMLVLDEETTIVRANRAAAQFAGKTAEELCGKRPGEALGCCHSTEDPCGCGFSRSCMNCSLRNAIKRVISCEVPPHGIEAAFDFAEGGAARRVWLRMGAEPTELDGRRHVIVSLDDITASKQAEQALRESEQTLRTIGDSAHDAILMMDSNSRIVFWNPAAGEMFGYRAEEALGQDLHGLVAPPQSRPGYQEHVALFHATGKGDFVGKTVELVGRRKDGGEFPLELSLARVSLHDQWYAIGIIRDITERREAQTHLEEYAVALESANKVLEDLTASAQAATKAKSEFLANMSHEIRTPLNGVIGMTGLLLDSELTAEQHEYAEIVRSSGETLLTVVNDILDFSKIEARRLDMETLDFDLRTTVEDATEMLAVKAYQKGLELTCLVESQVPSQLCGDPGRLRQILANLVGNAVKFTDHGEVAVRVGLVAEGDRTATLRFTVTDTGIGIPTDQLESIFAAFVQVDGSTTRKYGGTGLGLAIARQLVEMMDGQIGVESENGEGSTFWFTVVLQKQPNGRPEVEEAILDLHGVKALVVDDCSTSRLVMGDLLKSWGCHFAEAANGEAALEQLGEAARAGEPFQLALIDAHMPGLDGQELGRRIRASSELESTRLVMLTSLGSRSGAMGLEQQGFCGQLSKPIRRATFRDCLARALGREMRGNSMAAEDEDLVTPSSAVGSSDGRIRILLAEDSPTNQVVALSILRKLGYRADAVANGREAIKALEEVPYNLVLMDCQMPEMDGYEATRCIRSRHGGVRNPEIPIIAMTAHSMKGDKEKCLAAGMNDYLSKPVHPEEMADALTRWLATVEIAAPGSQQPDRMVLDREGFLKRLMDDGALARTILAGFLEDVPKQILALKEDLGAGNAALVCLRAHRMKGAAGTVGAIPLRDVAIEVEQAGKAGDLAQVAGLVSQLENELERVKTTVDQLVWA
jgi:PAS domain S-box-containing protein